MLLCIWSGSFLKRASTFKQRFYCFENGKSGRFIIEIRQGEIFNFLIIQLHTLTVKRFNILINNKCIAE